MVSLLIAAGLYAAVVAGGWAIGGTAGVIAALAVEHRLVRYRALTSRHHGHGSERRRLSSTAQRMHARAFLR